MKALNLTPIDQSPPAFVQPGDPFNNDFANIKASQVSGLEVSKAFPQLAALIENLRANPSGTSAAITPQMTPITPGKNKGNKKRGDGGDNANTPNKKGKSNADANTKTPKVPASPPTPGLRKDLVKSTKTHLTIELPATKYNETKVLNIPFKKLKTLTGLDRNDRCRTV